MNENGAVSRIALLRVLLEDMRDDLIAQSDLCNAIAVERIEYGSPERGPLRYLGRALSKHAETLTRWLGDDGTTDILF